MKEAEGALAMSAGEEEAALAAKSAQDYANAISAVADIAGIVVEFIPGVSAAKKVARFAPLAAKVAQKAAPILDEHAGSINAVVDSARESAPNALKTATGLAKKGGGAVASTVGKAFSTVTSPVKSSMDASRNRKAQIEAHRKIIEHATASMSVESFCENRAQHEQLSGGGGYLDHSGCYIFLTLGKGAKKDLASYRAVYVGASSNVGRSISDEIAGKGNADVYADIKYDQGVHILFYPCGESEMEKMRDSLIIALDADESYNRTTQ